MADDRLRRLCDVCGQLDTHPRHVSSVVPNSPGTVPDQEFINNLPDGLPARALAEILDNTTTVRHLDCCASKGCQICLDSLEAASSAHGDKLVKAIEGGAVNHLSDSKAEA